MQSDALVPKRVAGNTEEPLGDIGRRRDTAKQIILLLVLSETLAFLQTPHEGALRVVVSQWLRRRIRGERPKYGFLSPDGSVGVAA
ncbi:hypothetical protein PF003_g7700 [Phytophthora fragariae]|nr:hypothetical protein PF003_g7700 [Phytophthora fragariae]